MTARTRAELNSDADTLLPDNTTRQISPSDVRGRVKDLADSAVFPEDNPVEVIALTPSTGQNDYATGASPNARVRTVVNIAPSASIVITGISTSGWQTGKTVVLRNTTDPAGADARIVIIPRMSSSSSAANRINYPKDSAGLPLIIMPSEEITLRFDGSNLVLASEFGSARSRFDYVSDASSFTGTISGAGAAAGASSAVINSKAYAALQLQTGTAANGAAHVGLYQPSSFMAGSGCLLFMGSVLPAAVSSGTEEFMIVAGFNDLPLGSLTDAIAWVYDRPNSGNWRTLTMSNGTPTWQTVSGYTISVSWDLLGIFVNGDGTNVDFFFSPEPMGEEWYFAPSHTTNIPTGSARSFGGTVSVSKSVGTTNRSVYSTIIGSRWQREQ